MSDGQQQRDWMGLCNEFNIPVADFELQHCARCFQHECTRSRFGKSKFEARVANWEGRLFKEVPRMAEDDPRFEAFQAKKFVGVDPGPAPEVGRSAWVDPRDLTDEVSQYEIPETKQIEAEVTADLEEQGPVKVDEPAQKPQISNTPMARPVETGKAPAPMNTPNKPGQMIGGQQPQPAPEVPKADPWEPKKPAADDSVQVVKPGARFRFGGSGV